MTPSSITPGTPGTRGPTAVSLLRLAALSLVVACGGDDGAADSPDAGDRPDAAPAPTPPVDAGPSCDATAFRAEVLPDDGIANTEVRDLHGTGADDVWAVTSTGRVLHRSAATWSQSDRLAGPLNGVWAVDRDTTYVVGRFGFIARRDGAAWTIERRTDEPGNDLIELHAVHAASADEVWAVGERALGGAAVLRRDGDGIWTAVAAPAGARRGLRAVWAVAEGEVWAAGDDGVFAWNGARWTRRQSGGFAGVVAASDGTVWTLRAASFDGDGICRIAADAEPRCEALPGGDVVLGKDLVLVDGAPAIAAVASDRPVVAVRAGAGWEVIELATAATPLSLFGSGDAAWVGVTEAVRHRGCD